MKILLTHPDVAHRCDDPDIMLNTGFPCLGINYLAMALRKDGHDVKVIDSFFEYWQNGCQPRFHVNSGTLRELSQAKYDVVGLSCLTPTVWDCIEIAKQVRAKSPGTKIILGGPHATVMYRQLLSHYYSLIDAIIIGEGEVTTRELLSAFEKGSSLNNIKGIAYYDGSAKDVIKTMPQVPINMNGLEPIDYDQYIQVIPSRKLQCVSFLTMRGCPFKCSFCYVQLCWIGVRMQSPRRVVDEIQILKEKYGLEIIRFRDDTFTFDKARTVSIFRDIAKRKLDVRLYIDTRLDTVDEEVLSSFKKAGGESIYFGLETGSQTLRYAMRKDISNDQAEEVIALARKLGINVGLFLLLGHPGETWDDIHKTKRALTKLRPDEVTCNLVKIYPHTPLYTKAEAEGLVEEADFLNPTTTMITYVQGKKLKALLEQCHEIEREFSPKVIRRTIFESNIMPICEEGDNEKG